MRPLRLLVFAALASTVLLTNACGGGGGSNGNVTSTGVTTPPAASVPGDTQPSVNSSSSTQCGTGRENCFGLDPAFNAGPNCDPHAITCIKVGSTSAAAQASVPITFGQPFKAGDLPAGASLEARDANGAFVPLQMDEVSSHSDGSVRFAVLSAQLPNLLPSEKRTISLFKKTTSLPAAPGNVNTSAFDLKLVATVYSPQISVITFGNRVGTTAGTPYLENERITLQLGDSNPEQYVLTVTTAQAGGGHQTLTQIAQAFMDKINASSKNYVASKIGEGGGYEKLWITTSKTDGAAFGIKFVYSGAAVQTVANLQTYQAPRSFVASPRQALEAMIAKGQRPRLHGAVASEYTVVAPFVDANTGAYHPQLTARIHTRFVDAGQRVRNDMVIENNWTYAPNPGNITYDLTVTQGGQSIYRQAPFIHNHHARWHKVLWTGGEPQAQVRHNMRYFLDSKATWNYDLSLQVPESVLATEAANLANANTSPMGPALVTPYFPGTGGRPDIGPLPRWTVLYLLSQDPRQRSVMLANADAAASVPIHYRDSPSDQPVSLVTHPGLAMRFGSSTSIDALPVITNDSSIWSPDTNHQASFAYIPYMVTGDMFYLDETMFWANWNLGSKDPNYRQFGKGLLKDEEVRGQAWGLRSIGEAARSLPDQHSMKAYFNVKLADNLAWYNSVYPPRDPNDLTFSQIGMVERGSQLSDTRPWMNDYVAIVLGQLAENDEPAALSYLQWLSRFTVGRFTHESAGYCAAYAAVYTLQLFDSAGKQITDWGALFRRNWPSITKCDPNQAPLPEGYPELAIGYAASARTMLAVSSSLNISNASTAYPFWKNKTPKMDAAFSADPTWAVVPRTALAN